MVRRMSIAAVPGASFKAGSVFVAQACRREQAALLDTGAVQVRAMSGKVRNKTKSAAKKRFFFNAKGAVKRGKAGRGHKLVNKSRNRVNRLGEQGTSEGGDLHSVRRMLQRGPPRRWKAMPPVE